MKLSQLTSRIAVLEKRLEELEQVKGMHWTKRPEKWKGVGGAASLNRELDAIGGELRELRAWKRGHWYVDDLGAGGGWHRQPLLRAA